MAPAAFDGPGDGAAAGTARPECSEVTRSRVASRATPGPPAIGTGSTPQPRRLSAAHVSQHRTARRHGLPERRAETAAVGDDISTRLEEFPTVPAGALDAGIHSRPALQTRYARRKRRIRDPIGPALGRLRQRQRLRHTADPAAVPAREISSNLTLTRPYKVRIFMLYRRRFC